MIDVFNLDEFTRQYLATALWSTNHQDTEEPLDVDFDIDNFDEKSLQLMIDDCGKFQQDNASMIKGRESDAGHDFWLTRKGWGDGFWDDWPEHGDKLAEASEAYDEVTLYASDNEVFVI